MQTQDTQATDIWFERGVQKLDEAQAAIHGDPDDGVLATVELALECLEAAWGSKPSEGLEDYFRPEPEPPCTCRPGLVESGGFSSRCALHGR
jgi:hypothetical protein